MVKIDFWLLEAKKEEIMFDREAKGIVLNININK